jgi:histidine ammonia-lyase
LVLAADMLRKAIPEMPMCSVKRQALLKEPRIQSLYRSITRNPEKPRVRQ